ncbi:hypothetical protein OK016_13185 [Vibrio chagasii]|nr:hypothetical protein [Vibrio chagasii]
MVIISLSKLGIEPDSTVIATLSAYYQQLKGQELLDEVISNTRCEA